MKLLEMTLLFPFMVIGFICHRIYQAWRVGKEFSKYLELL